MADLYFLLNPRAGRCRSVDIIQQARRHLWGYELKFLSPDSVDEAAELVRAIDPNTCRALVVCGGDGTINTVLQYLGGRKVPIYPLPLGTANDLAAYLGVTYDWGLMQTILDTSEPTAIDLIRVNGHYFATVGGIGVGASLSDEINEKRATSPVFRAFSDLLREQVYTYMSAKTIVMERSWVHRIRISTPDFEEDLVTGLVLVCNQHFLGGDMVVAPGAKNNDGMMEIMINNVSHRPDLLRLLYDLKRGHTSPHTKLIKTQNVVIENLDGEAMQVFGDGEPIMSSVRLDFQIQPAALQIFRGPQRP